MDLQPLVKIEEKAGMITGWNDMGCGPLGYGVRGRRPDGLVPLYCLLPSLQFETENENVFKQRLAAIWTLVDNPTVDTFGFSAEHLHWMVGSALFIMPVQQRTDLLVWARAASPTHMFAVV